MCASFLRLLSSRSFDWLSARGWQILEKKAIDDKFRESKGLELSTLPEFIEDFFLNKYGLENVAFGKLQVSVASRKRPPPSANAAGPCSQW